MRLIDADELLEEIVGIHDGWRRPSMPWHSIEDSIKNAPTINPKELLEEKYKKLLQFAVELLKEQEAELSYREAKAITHTATKLDDATCPSCGNVVGEKIRTGAIGQSIVQVRWDYCRFCGQKLDWEGR